MVRYGFTVIAVIAVIMTISIQQAFALKCWHCNRSEPLCGDPFNGNRLTDEAFVDCPVRPWGEPLCVKAKQTSTGYVQRTCANSQQEAELTCKFGSGIVDICETCDGPFCNSATQSVTVIFVAIMKVLFL